MAKLTNPYLFIGILIITVIASGAMCNVLTASENSTDSLLVSNGSTVVSGDLLIDSTNMRKEPLTSNPFNLLRPLANGNVMTVVTSIITGAAPKNVIKEDKYITSDDHISDDLNGPGTVIVDSNGKISVQSTEKMVWGYKLSDTYAIKSGDKLNLVKNNQTIKTLTKDEINNDSVPTDFVSAKGLISWFETAKNGSNITVDYYLGNFSDGRKGVHGKENITRLFGESTYGYMRNYTPGAPVLVYEHNASEVKVSSGLSYVEDLAGYPTAIRAANAREFAQGWNGTIIPPHGSAHGKENVSFTAIAESEAASGTATHGVCPPGRSLRQAILALGNPLPVGMSGDNEAILYEYRPTIDVLVSNNGNYPIKIIMWTEGEGGATRIYTNIYELRDNATYVNNTTSNSSSN